MSDSWKADSFEYNLSDWDSELNVFSQLGNSYLPESRECMNCGQCLSSCSSFYLNPIHEESPRGRVAIIRKLLVDQQEINSEEHQHLNNCLECRACETVCPSQMAYSHWFDKAQAQLTSTCSQSRVASAGFWLIAHKHWRKLLLPGLALMLKSGLIQLSHNIGLLAKIGLASLSRFKALPTLSELSTVYPVKKTKYRGRVALFTGCLAEHFDRATLMASIKLLNAFGYEVVVPHEQTCCGALHQHHGFSAKDFIEQNIATFYGLEVEAVIYTASGCGSMLSEYPDQDQETGGWFHRYLYDIHEFLLRHWPDNLQLAASNLRVAVHEPCSQRNVIKNTASVYSLLEKIPGIILESLPDNQICCGAGGSYMLSHTEQAEQLRALKWQHVLTKSADLVVTSNFGCAFHLNSGERPSGLKFMHPIRLLADRL